MEYTESLTHAIDFIESNLTEPITVDSIAALSANYSLYHFVRLFRLLTGETPGSYLRKRRLGQAAQEIVSSNKPIIQIALDYQFQSQEAFSRAFKKHFGITPGKQRKIRQFVHLTPRAVLWEATIDDEAFSPPQIRSLPALLLAGIAYYGDNADGALTGIWQQFNQQIERIPHPAFPFQFYGLWRYPNNFQVTRDFGYLAALVVDRLVPLPGGMSGQRLSARQYAVFEHHGSIQTIRQTYTHAYEMWLPHSGYQPAAQYDLEGYDERFTGPDRDDSLLSILIPIRDGDKPQKVSKSEMLPLIH